MAVWCRTLFHLSDRHHYQRGTEEVAAGAGESHRIPGRALYRRGFSQQWFSVAGNGSKQTSQINLQYFIQYFLPRRWAIRTSPNMLVNWYTSAGNKVTFPIGVDVSKVQKFGWLPVKFAIQGQYMPVSPELFGQRWNISSRRR